MTRHHTIQSRGRSIGRDCVLVRLNKLSAKVTIFFAPMATCQAGIHSSRNMLKESRLIAKRGALDSERPVAEHIGILSASLD